MIDQQLPNQLPLLWLLRTIPMLWKSTNVFPTTRSLSCLPFLSISTCIPGLCLQLYASTSFQIAIKCDIIVQQTQVAFVRITHIFPNNAHVEIACNQCLKSSRLIASEMHLAYISNGVSKKQSLFCEFLIFQFHYVFLCPPLWLLCCHKLSSYKQTCQHQG